MKNKYRIGEIVLIDGIGSSSNKRVKGLAIIQNKEYDYNEYAVRILATDKEDWFSENEIISVMKEKFKKQDKYKVALAINKKGLDIIRQKVNSLSNKNNNILEKVDVYKEYKAFKKTYAILIWTSTYWSDNNFAVRSIEETLKELRSMDIAYKRIIIGESNPTFVDIKEFVDNDPNVDIFEFFQMIKVKEMGGILV